MKKLLTFTLFCCALATISSCSKSINEPSASKDISGSSKTGSPTGRMASTLDLTSVLTSQTWVYYEYFSDFGSPSTTLAWKTNRTSNTINLALNQVKYNTDGTYSEIDQNGNTFNGTWTFLNNQTQVQVVNSLGTFTSTIELLNSERYEWLAASGTYGVMVPKGQPVDSTGDRTPLLTAHNWVYQEYFTNWGQTAPSLVWKTNKSNSTLNLSQNVAKFNTDGTYWEIDQNGIFLSGTWNFLNGQTQLAVHNSQGTYTSTIKLLTADRLEWLDTTGAVYGEEIPQ